MKALFIDPASKSTGWALFEDGEYKESGTITATEKQAEDRIKSIHLQYTDLAFDGFDIDEVHIEQFGGRPSHMLHWSVGAIISAFQDDVPVRQDIPVSSWQKHCDWKGKRKPLKPYLKSMASEDQLAAVGMGLWFYGKENKGV